MANETTPDQDPWAVEVPYWAGGSLDRGTPQMPAAPQWAAPAEPDAAGPRVAAAVEQADFASPFLRLTAFVIDVVFLYAGMLVLAVPIIVVDAVAPETPLAVVVVLLTALVWGLFVFVYPSLAEGRLGQMYGKHLLGIRIVSTRTGEPIGGGSAFGRNIVRSLGAYAFGLGILWMLWDRKRQGWHDKAARTVVVRDAPAKRDDPLQHLRRVLAG